MKLTYHSEIFVTISFNDHESDTVVTNLSGLAAIHNGVLVENEKSYTLNGTSYHLIKFEFNDEKFKNDFIEVVTENQCFVQGDPFQIESGKITVISAE